MFDDTEASEVAQPQDSAQPKPKPKKEQIEPGKRRGLPRNIVKHGKAYYFRHPGSAKEFYVGRKLAKYASEIAEANLHFGGRALRMNRPEEVDAAGLFSEEFIVSIAKPKEKICGVYFLILHECVAYVGSSINIWKRMGEHAQDPTKQFDSIAIIPCRAKHMRRLEARYISKFCPAFNRQAPKIRRR